MAAVAVKLSPKELEALDKVFAAAGIETRTDGLRRLIQSAGGTFVLDVQLAAQMALDRASLNDLGNGVAQLTKRFAEANQTGQGAEVFKAIWRGGTHSISELSNQFGYLTMKSTHIVDSSGFLDGKAKLEPKERTERFAKRRSAGIEPRLGQTTHMLLSYPIG
ncbi:MAG: hypothetical protein AAGI03_00270 [Pseudomonadota bacterium]